MEGSSIAHDLPELYRAVLDVIATLEATGHRAEALLVRRAAIAAYSDAWDDTAVQRLERLRIRADHVLDGNGRVRLPRTTRLALRWSRTA